MITQAMIAALSGQRVLVVGDCMLDAYLMGDAERISPEAPVPVVRIDEERHFLGGAGNVARNVAALGGTATLIGGVGADVSGQRLRELLLAEGVSQGLTELSRPTTVKTRVLARRQQMLRLDHEDSSAYSAAENALVLHKLNEHLPDHDVVILSDYSKGLITREFMREFAELVRLHPVRVLVDPKPSNVGLYTGATLLTPNARETGECAAHLGAGTFGNLNAANRRAVLAAGRGIMASLGIAHLLTTLGSDGMALFVSTDEVWHIPTVARDVFDVTGAGDTVIATLALSLAAGNDLLASCVLANYAAGIVVGQVGAAVADQAALQSAVDSETVDVQRWL